MTDPRFFDWCYGQRRAIVGAHAHPQFFEEALMNTAIKTLLTVTIGALAAVHAGTAGAACTAPGCAGTPSANMPEIAPIGPSTGKYMDIP